MLNDEETLDSFVQTKRPGSTWKPERLINWQESKRNTGVFPNIDHTEPNPELDGSVRQWFKTSFAKLWYLEIRMEDTNELMARYLWFANE